MKTRMHTDMSEGIDNRDIKYDGSGSSRNTSGLGRSTRKAPKQSRGLVGWWYSWTAPKAPEADASLAAREIDRRGRLASIILFFITFLGVVATPGIVFGSKNPYALISHPFSLMINVIALFLNRRGRVTAAGVLVVLSVTLSLMISLVVPGKVGVSSLPLFSLLALPELIAVSLLPAGWVFASALFNSLFVWANLSFLPHAKDLDQLLAQFRYGLIIEPILLYALVAVVTFLWVRSASEAIKRADRAEEIAALEQREIEQKQQLDIGIQQILQTHVQVANGNFQVRAPLARENALWQIAYSLNNLIARLQRYSGNEIELRRARAQAAQLGTDLQRAKAQTSQLVTDLQRAKGHHYPIRSPKGGTFLDSVTEELSGYYLDSEPSNTKHLSKSLKAESPNKEQY